MPLKNRRMFPPGGFVFFQPQTGWSPPPGLTFEQTVQEIIKHRSKNVRFSSQWSLDDTEVANELDNFTCLRIANDPNYCMGGIASKKEARSPLQRLAGSAKDAVAGVRKVAAGVGVLLDWLGAGAQPVDASLANGRAAVCAGCPQNKPGDLTSFFTVPASELIRKQIGIRDQMNLSTPNDGALGVCEACACPLKLKVHVALSHIKPRLSDAVKSKLDPRCWILKENL